MQRNHLQVQLERDEAQSVPMDGRTKGDSADMKRLHIITKPTTVDSLADFDSDAYENTWQLKAERLETRRLRKFRRQMA